MTLHYSQPCCQRCGKLINPYDEPVIEVRVTTGISSDGGLTTDRAFSDRAAWVHVVCPF